MIERVVVSLLGGSSLDLVLGAPEQSGVLIHSIDGLSQETADVGVYKIASGRSKQSHTSRRPRNITLRLVPIGVDVEAIRQTLSSYFPLEQMVSLKFVTSTKTVTATGTVESFMAGIFKKQQVISISVLCTDPYFYGNPVVLPVSTPTQNTTLSVNYAGELPTGFDIKMTMTDDPGNIFIVKTGIPGVVEIDTAKLEGIVGPIEDGDILKLSSGIGNKRIRHTRSGVTKSVFSILNDDVIWLSLNKGVNEFGIELINQDNVSFVVEYPVVYGGI